MASISAVLRAVAPGANSAFIAASEAANAGAIMARFGLTTPKAQAQVIGQMAAECGFNRFEENLNYSAKRLVAVWPKRFPSEAAARPFAQNPKALAINVYGGRMGNRPGTEDGWTYRGSGGLQHTGRSEFDRVRRRTGVNVVDRPELLRQAAAAAAIWQGACSYVVDRGALSACMAGDTEAATVKINGGKIGLADRKIMVARAERALNGRVVEESVVAGAAGPVSTELKTTAEEADDKKRTAVKAAIGAPVASGGSAGGAKQGGTDWGAAIGIGIAVLVAGVVLAVMLWRRFGAANEKVEVQQLEALKLRADAPPAEAQPA